LKTHGVTWLQEAVVEPPVHPGKVLLSPDLWAWFQYGTFEGYSVPPGARLFRFWIQAFTTNVAKCGLDKSRHCLPKRWPALDRDPN